MFSKFKKKFSISEKKSTSSKSTAAAIDFKKLPKSVEVFFAEFEGCSFNDGLYRVHNLGDIKKWNKIVSKEFSDYNNILCFAYDWMGRQFAIDLDRTDKNQNLLLMCDPGAGEILESELSFADFHNNDLVDYFDDLFSPDLFFACTKDKKLKREKCFGYMVPLFLSGSEDIDNLELSDMEVYWEICAQTFKQIKDLPEGSKISSFNIK